MTLQVAESPRTFDARRANNLRASLKTEQRAFRQRKLIDLMVELDDPVVADALVWAIENKKTDFVRASAADGLAQHRTPEGRAALLAAAQSDTSQSVRRRAMLALVGLELSREEIESLAPGCFAGDKHLRLAFAELIGAQTEKSAVPHLLRLLEDPKFLVRFEAFLAIRDREDPQLLPALHRAAEKEARLMRALLHSTAEAPPDDQDE
jgi:HEAT repeat protein